MNEQIAAAKQAEDSFTTDSEPSQHDLINEDTEEVPKYVPKEIGGIPSTGPLIMQRKMTLTKSQVTKNKSADEEPHNTLLDCILCKNIMINPRECENCRKGFCHACIDNYINQLIAGDYEICCPNCSSS